VLSDTSGRGRTGMASARNGERDVWPCFRGILDAIVAAMYGIRQTARVLAEIPPGVVSGESAR